MSYNSQALNKIVYPSGSSLNVRELPSTGSKILFVATAAAGRATGQYMKYPDGDWYQIALYDTQKKATGKDYGYVRSDVCKFQTAPAVTTAAVPSTNECQSVLNDLGKSDKDLMIRIASAYRLVDLVKRKGYSTQAEEEKLKQILKNYSVRRTELQNSSLFKVRDSLSDFNSVLSNFGGPLFYSSASAFFSNLIHGIGALPIYAVDLIIVGAVSLAIYLMLKGMLTQSALDNKWSGDVEKILQAKLTTQEYAKVNQEKDSLIKKAYSQGKSDASTFGDLKWIAAAIAAMVVVPKILTAVNVAHS